MPKKARARRDGIYTRKDRPGYWGAWTDAQGRWVQRKLKGAFTLEQARTKLSEEKRKVEEHLKFGKPLPTEETFDDFADEFLLHQRKRIAAKVVKGKISQAEYDRRKGIVEKHLKTHFGGLKLAAIRKKDVNAYINKRLGAVSDATIIKEVGTLKRLFRVAIDAEKVEVNPATGSDMPAAPEGRCRWLTPDEWRAVFAACTLYNHDWSEVSRRGKLNKKRVKQGLPEVILKESLPLPTEEQWLQHAVALAVSLGTRRGELMNIVLTDVDLDRGTILLRNTKNGKPRLAFINELAMQVLKSMNVDGRKRQANCGPLFVGITPAQLSVAFSRACNRAGVEDFRLHDLRHTFASHLRMNGADLHDLQKLLGHSDPRMTSRYSHLSNEHLATAARRLDGVLSIPALPSESSAEALVN